VTELQEKFREKEKAKETGNSEEEKGVAEEFLDEEEKKYLLDGTPTTTVENRNDKNKGKETKNGKEMNPFHHSSLVQVIQSGGGSLPFPISSILSPRFL